MAPVNVVTAQTFDPSRLAFGEPQVIKLNKGTMNKIPIKYDDKDLIIQSPVFERASIRTFDKKTEEDRNAMVMYQSIQYQDEEEYARTVIDGLSDAVKGHVRDNVRSLFNRKKDTMADLTFNSHVQEPADYRPSIKTAVPLASKDAAEPANSVKFYRGGKDALTKQEMLDTLAETNMTASMRSLVSVPYAYTLNNKQYGFKTFLCTLDLSPKPEDAKPLDGAPTKDSTTDSSVPALGNAFV